MGLEIILFAMQQMSVASDVIQELEIASLEFKICQGNFSSS
jgi:hypothetical protein